MTNKLRPARVVYVTRAISRYVLSDPRIKDLVLCEKQNAIHQMADYLLKNNMVTERINSLEDHDLITHEMVVIDKATLNGVLEILIYAKRCTESEGIESRLGDAINLLSGVHLYADDITDLYDKESSKCSE
jgi:hypothetical protein